MRHMSIIAVAWLATLIPGHAFASVYNFQSTETSALSSSPTTFNFSLDTSGAIFGAGTTSFSDVAITENGTQSLNNTVSVPFDTNISSPLFFFVDTDPTTLAFSSGTGSGITFNTGTFAIADGFTEGEGTLTVSNVSTVSAVPEPSTWSLMLVGVGLAGVMVRYRKPRVQAISAA